MDRGGWQATQSMGLQRVDMTELLSTGLISPMMSFQLLFSYHVPKCFKYD